ncbi:2-dehydropantoate 2-reductase [Angulomicrobium tetraedrale]|uniref:2-dehydropantoate 2-reductase n=1 Tax=Ancylobacter tetraedralis TaxID=217068 RepID=A0A839Z7H4_9HYPH|nr:2-dehydropantoate 2-reductase [Ancylobacter tetraedralis]MBB3770025.1 2-dehydropantoate 2-reductase [Ancylobacter tetraedralis]
MAPRIAIIGAGAVGGYIGAQLAAAGEDVTLVDGWAAHVAAVRAYGFRVDGMAPEETAAIPVTMLHESEIGRLGEGPAIDLTFIAVKSYATRHAAERIRPFLAPGALVVSAQNGINEDVIGEVVGHGRVAGLIAARIGVELDGPGHVQRMVPRGSPGIDVFRVGEPDGRLTERIEALGALLRKVDSVKVTTNLAGERWSKLAANAMRNGVSAASGLSINALDRDPALRRFGIKVAGEAIRVGERLGFALESIGPVPATLYARADEGDGAALAKVEEALLAAALATKARSDAQRPSMGQDVAKGRPTEVEEIYGLVIARAREVGVAVPANEHVRAVVREIEAGRAKPHPALLLSFASRGTDQPAHAV